MLLLIFPCFTYGGDNGLKHSEKNVKWGYTGLTGPYYWGKLTEDYRLCSTGKNQSPINLIPGFRTRTLSPFRKQPFEHKILPPLQFLYQPTPLRIENNGHTIQVNYQPGSKLVVGQKEYQLLQFHFHIPSEHLIMGRSSEMEMHLVHKDSEGQIAVVGVLMRRGMHNRALQLLWDFLPAKNQKVHKNQLHINVKDLLRPFRTYFHYVGSLTTPPCSENIQWYVLKSPSHLSEMQLVKFRYLFSYNSRPVQRLYQRQIFER